MAAERNKQLVTGIYEAFAGGDFLPSLLAALRDDVRWGVSYIGQTTAQEAGIPYLSPVTGKDGVTKYFAEWADKLDVLQFDVDKIIADGDTVVAWTHQKLKVKETGKEVEDYVVHEFIFGDDGKMTAHYHWCDTKKHIDAFKP